MSAVPAAELSRVLDLARREGRAIERLTKEHPALTLDEAYRIQEEGIALRASSGDRLAGFKMGLTSKAKMKQMGVETPIMGMLTESMRVASGGRIRLRGLIHPRIEPEIAFILGRELRGGVSAEEALDACSGACAAMEILDSRFRDFSFSLPDVIADNCSSCAFVLGEVVRKPREVDLGQLRIELAVDGAPVESGSSDAIYGHPAQSLAELASMLAARGRSLPAGSLVLAGAATKAVALKAGALAVATVEGFGEVRVQVEP
jgi:2-oxo-3-hexenedioate decarboxylase